MPGPGQGSGEPGREPACENFRLAGEKDDPGRAAREESERRGAGHEDDHERHEGWPETTQFLRDARQEEEQRAGNEESRCEQKASLEGMGRGCLSHDGGEEMQGVGRWQDVIVERALLSKSVTATFEKRTRSNIFII